MSNEINPVFTDEWQTVKEIKDRTGHDRNTIHRAVRAAMAAKLVVCKLVGDETLMIPAFRRKNEGENK